MYHFTALMNGSGLSFIVCLKQKQAFKGHFSYDKLLSDKTENGL